MIVFLLLDKNSNFIYDLLRMALGKTMWLDFLYIEAVK